MLRQSIWDPFITTSSAEHDVVEALERPSVADVCVIGAGLSGLLCALELLERGYSVRMLQRSSIGAGETGQTTAHLTCVLDTRYYELARMHGKEAPKLIAQSQRAAIAHLERVANAHNIACGFERISAFLCATRTEQRSLLERELRAATDAGVECQLLRSAPAPFDASPALHTPNQAKFNPGEFMRGVVKAVRDLGGHIHAHTSVKEIKEEGTSVRVVTTSGSVVEARSAIVATNTPINDVVAMHTKQAAYRSYAIAAPLSDNFTDGLFWDLEDPYHYVRSATLQAAGHAAAEPWLIVGGEDHKVGQEAHPEQCWERLQTWLKKYYPTAGPARFKWSGQILEPADGLGYIGRNPTQERVYLVTGQSGNGMTYAALGGLIVADLIDGKQNPWARIYDPARKPSSLSALATYTSENLNVAAQYLDWVEPAEVGNPAVIPIGEGAILRRGLKKIAAYKDAAGKLHTFSASCPHLKGVVAWNRAEKSWDCPCHGSRFDCYGKVINGPAVGNLTPATKDDDEPLHDGVEVSVV